MAKKYTYKVIMDITVNIEATTIKDLKEQIGNIVLDNYQVDNYEIVGRNPLNNKKE